MSDQQISNRGEDAARVLDNPAYRDAMDALKQSVIAKWREVGVRDKEGLILTHQLMTLAETFDGLLRGYVEAGKMAAHNLAVARAVDEARNESVARRIVRRVL